MCDNNNSKLLSLKFELYARSLPACLLSDNDGSGSQQALSREGSPVELLISGGVEDRFFSLGHNAFSRAKPQPG